MYQRFVYVSQAAPGLGARDTYDIIRVATKRNSQLCLTGALLFLDGYFVQLLEGQPHQVQSRFDRIVSFLLACCGRALPSSPARIAQPVG